MSTFLERTRREYRIPPRLGWTVAALCIAAGSFIALYFGKPNLDRARASKGWPTTDGRIEMSEVGRKTDNDGLRYFTQIRYSYAVDNQRYESKTVWVGDDFFSSSPTSHEETVRRYPVNSNVKVHYDSARPEVAVLETGLFPSNYGVFVAGMGLIVVGVWIAFKTARENRESCQRREARN